jgi:uncharacterized membrane protein
MRLVLVALGLWLGIQAVLVTILITVSVIEGREAKREAAMLERQYLLPSPEPIAQD